MIFTSIDEKSFQITVNSALYSSEVIHKCFYWYSVKYSVEIIIKNKSFIITITDPNKEWNIDQIFKKIKTDLIDYKTREIIFNETKNIREMLIAKAFAYNDEFDEQPPGDVNDPINLEPSKI